MKRKIVRRQLISVYEMEVFCFGHCMIRGMVDDGAVLKRWPEFRNIIMQWWFSQDDCPEFCRDFEDFPKVKRFGCRPYAWWNERGAAALELRRAINDRRMIAWWYFVSSDQPEKYYSKFPKGIKRSNKPIYS